MPKAGIQAGYQYSRMLVKYTEIARCLDSRQTVKVFAVEYTD